MSVPYRLLVVSSYGTLCHLLGGGRKKFFCFFSYFLNFLTFFPQKKSLPPTYLPTMEVPDYEKQILLYGRHGRDAVGCSVGGDGRSGGWLRSGMEPVRDIERRVVVR